MFCKSSTSSLYIAETRLTLTESVGRFTDPNKLSKIATKLKIKQWT